MQEHILQINNKQEFLFLRKKTKPFDFSAHSQNEVRDLIQLMRSVMRKANGVGLSANQIGIDARVFVAEIPGSNNGNKFYSIFNPTIEKFGMEKDTMEEGCLSVPHKFGEVPRSKELVLHGFDKKGKPIKIKAWGFIARVFQHEVDHLNGKIFIDKATKIHEVPVAKK